MTTYTLAIGADMLLATVPDGSEDRNRNGRWDGNQPGTSNDETNPNPCAHSHVHTR